MRRSIFALAALTMGLALAGGADAKQCRDAHGKFIKCVVHAPQCKTGVPCGNTCIAKGKVCHKPAPLQRCRDKHGRFAKCPPASRTASITEACRSDAVG